MVHSGEMQELEQVRFSFMPYECENFRNIYIPSQLLFPFYGFPVVSRINITRDRSVQMQKKRVNACYE